MTVNVSIIVPTYNGAEKLPACLDSLLSQKTDRRYEIIVVNDGSTDNTSDVARGYEGVRLINQENSGPGAARNRGVEEASGEIVVFIDDDCVAERDWLEKMLVVFENSPDVVGVKGAYLTGQRELVARFVQIEYEEKYDRLMRHRYIDFIDTYSAAFRRSVFLEAGGYDRSFPTASVEDQEFSFRLADAGHKMVFAPGAKVCHTHVNGLGDYIRKKFKIGYWKTLVLKKNPNRVSGDSHTPLTLRLQILLLAALVPSLLFLVAGLYGALVPLALTVLFLLTTLPLVVRCLRRDPAVGVLSPLFIMCRAGGLTMGLARGALDHIL